MEPFRSLLLLLLPFNSNRGALGDLLRAGGMTQLLASPFLLGLATGYTPA